MWWRSIFIVMVLSRRIGRLGILSRSRLIVRLGVLSGSRLIVRLGVLSRSRLIGRMGVISIELEQGPHGIPLAPTVPVVFSF
jgi:hypothetical protein